MNRPCNIAARLPELARERPDQIAIRCPGRRGAGSGMAAYDVTLDYRQLDARSDAMAAGLAGYGIGRGVRTVVMVRPSPEFFLLMFALFKLGAVPVLVDPGIDRRALKQCLDEAQPQAFIGIPLAHVARLVLRWAPSATRLVTVGRRLGWGGTTLAALERAGASAGPMLADTDGEDMAAILFTSGSTGVPKGVVYRHRHFVGQIQLLGSAFGMEAGGVDLPTFPPFALFDPALGLTSVIPDMDPTRPAQADPGRLHDAIQRFGVTQLFGSPALMRVLARHGRPLPTVTRVTSAGAPVPPDVVATIRSLLPADAQFWTPYGATECLPVAVVEGRELERTRAATEAGAGTCVGNVVAPTRCASSPSTTHRCRTGRRRACWRWGSGEITVAGPTATDSYFNRPQATAAAKIRETLVDGSTRVVHRMGDVGYFDVQGRLWFCGRKTQRVETARGPLYTEQVEPVFNTVAGVARTALVGVGAAGAQVPVLCVELQRGRSDSPALQEALRAHAAARLPGGRPAALPGASGVPRRYPSQRQDRPRKARRLGQRRTGEARMKILVTGGGGFLGRALCRGLVERGHQVLAFNRSHYTELQAMGVGQIRGDLADAQAVLHAVAGVDAVFHNGAKAGAWGSYDSYHQANVVGTDNVLAACRVHGINRLVYTSTPSVTHRATHPVEGLGADEVPYGEDFQAPYAATKAIAEQRVLAANDASLATVALRPRLIWGPGDQQLVPRLAERARQGRLRLVGDGNNKVDTTYIDNAALAHFLAFDALAPGAACAGKAYFISNGEPLPMRELVNKLLAAVGAPSVDKAISFKTAYRIGAVCERLWPLLRLRGEPPLTRFLAEQLCTPHWYSMEPARRDFGYVPQVSIEEGLRRLKASSAA